MSHLKKVASNVFDYFINTVQDKTDYNTDY